MIVANAVVNDSRVLKTAFSLSKYGLRVHVFGLSTTPEMQTIEGYPFRITLIANPRFEMKKKGQWWLDNEEYNIQAFIDRMSDLFAAAIGDDSFDILHTHDMFGLPIGSKLREQCSIGASGWIHDLHEYVEGCTNLPDFIRLFLWEEEKRHIVEPDALTTVSPILASIIAERYNVDAPNVVLNAPRRGDFDMYHPQSIRRALHIANDVPLLIYNGGIKPPRGVQYAIEALEGLPEVHLALLTNSTGEFMNELLTKAKKLQVEHRIHMHKFVPNYDVTSFIRDADIGINPVTIYENSDLALPNKLFEYMHAGLPVVSSDTTAMRAFISENACGNTFPAENIAELVNVIRKTLSEYPEGVPNVAQGSALAEKYCWEEQEKVLGRIYDGFVSFSSKDRVHNVASKVEPVLHLPTHAASQPRNLTKGLRTNGLKAWNAALGHNNFSYASDIPIENHHNAFDAFKSYFADQGLSEYGTYHYHIRSLVHNNRYDYPTGLDLVLLKAMGKRVFFQFRGSEARRTSLFKEMTKYNYCDEHQDNLDKTMPYKFNEEDQQRFRDFVFGVCDDVFVNDPELQCYIPGALIVPRVVDLSQMPHKPPKSEGRLKIVHAPSRSVVKGTEYVQKAVETLREEGHDFDFTVVKSMPHAEAVQIYEQADIIIDQLRIGWYGVLAVEGMALGKAVVAYIRNDLRHYLPCPSPVVNANPENIVDVLRYLLSNPQEVQVYGKRGRAFAQDYHDADEVAKALIELYCRPVRAIDPIAVAEFMHYQNLTKKTRLIKKLSKKELSKKKGFFKRYARLIHLQSFIRVARSCGFQEAVRKSIHVLRS
jgi:glycosyltransferase involved in cell wall biosynthesis